MYQLGMVSIGGAHGKPSMFSAAVQNQFQGGPALRGYSMGFVSDQQYYNQAKAAVTSFDQLSNRVSRIADKAARDKIISDYGMADARPGDLSLNNSSLSIRNQTQAWIAKADATGDPGDGFADDGAHGRHRVDRLVSQVGDISSAVQDAELTYGILAAPAVQINPTQAPASSASDYVVPVLAVGGVVALAIVTGVFG